jgi:DMSO reductase anchor subunit
MRPALSVIFFTSVSGVGYGLTFWLGLWASLGVPQSGGLLSVVGLGLGFLLISAGLLSSTLHLHHPERAWRALSQWRSSWLSREGVAAMVAYVPLIWLGLTLWQGEASLVAALLVMVTSLVTVVCTAMIYASLKPIRAWCHYLVPAVYLGFALASGAFWLLLLLAPAAEVPVWLPVAGIVALGGVWFAKFRYWHDVDLGRSESTAATATGLGGTVSPLDPPHTEENYLLHEMAYKVARRHGDKLRRIAVVSGLLLPLLCLSGLLLPAVASGALLGVGALALTVGIMVERWLFFAEATHTVTLYYGATQA